MRDDQATQPRPRASLADKMTIGKTGPAAIAAGIGLTASMQAGAAPMAIETLPLMVRDLDNTDICLDPSCFAIGFLDVDNDLSDDFSIYTKLYSYANADGDFLFLGDAFIFGYGSGASVVTDGTYSPFYLLPYAAALGVGETIDAALISGSSSPYAKLAAGYYYYDADSMTSDSYGFEGAWVTATEPSFLGLAFEDADGEEHYAYAKTRFNPETFKVSLLCGEYETTPGAPITTADCVAEIPEPGTLLLAAAGAAPLLAYRRRRRKAQRQGSEADPS